MRQIYVEKIPWGEILFEDEFKAILDGVMTEVLEKHELVGSFADALDKILATLAKREHGKGFFPSSELCPKCKTSHEAQEFLQALCIDLTSTLLSEKFSDQIKPVLERHDVKGLIQL